MRLPAEWEEQDAVLVAWPHEGTDWREALPEVQPVFAAIVAAVSRHETALVVCSDAAVVAEQARRAGADMERVWLEEVGTNDTWARDFGPITVMEGRAGRERPVLLDFGFNGWGLKYAADRDNLVTRTLHARGVFGAAPLRTRPLVLEGGSIESDGAGTLLTTTQCLLGPNRNPHLDERGIEQVLRQELGLSRVLWLRSGGLTGDDTDGHVDTLARLCPDGTIAYVRCDNPADERYDDLRRMEEELREMRTAEGQPYRLLPLPWPGPVRDEGGFRLPATYANFLVINGAVLVPLYRDPHDEMAMAVMADAFPDREIIGIDCVPLVYQFGSLHCVTMQLPKGVLA